MKKIYLIISSISLALLLSACGGGSGDATFESGSVNIVVIQCDNNNSTSGTNDCGNVGTPDYFTCLNDGDTLVSDDDNTLYRIEDAAGTKKVCVKVTIPAGSAHIVRGN